MALSDNGREANEALSYNGGCHGPCFQGLIKESNRGLCQWFLCLYPVRSSRSYPFRGLDFISHRDVSVVADLESFFIVPDRIVLVVSVPGCCFVSCRGVSIAPDMEYFVFVLGRIVSAVSIPGPLKFV